MKFKNMLLSTTLGRIILPTRRVLDIDEIDYIKKNKTYNEDYELAPYTK